MRTLYGNSEQEVNKAKLIKCHNKFSQLLLKQLKICDGIFLSNCRGAYIKVM